MPNSLKLENFPSTKYNRLFKKYLKGLVSDLNRAGAVDYDVEVISFLTRSIPGRIATALIGFGYGKAEEAMLVNTNLHDCEVEILVPVGIGKISLPYIISVLFPTSNPWKIVYRKKLTGFKWESEPKNQPLIKELKKAVPKAIRKQKQHQKALEYILKQCYSFQRSGGGNTEWLIYSGYEGGTLSGGYRPRASRYLLAIPEVKNVLKRWN